MNAQVKSFYRLFWTAAIGFAATAIVNNFIPGEGGIVLIPFYLIFTIIGIISFFKGLIIWRSEDEAAKKQVKVPFILMTLGIIILLLMVSLGPFIFNYINYLNTGVY